MRKGIRVIILVPVKKMHLDRIVRTRRTNIETEVSTETRRIHQKPPMPVHIRRFFPDSVTINDGSKYRLISYAEV